jgi:hypothetical protein
MGPGFRYHVATLVGVFMALGVGMVIGSSFLQEALVERLRLQLTRLNERFTNEIEPLRRQVEDKDKAIGTLTSRVTRRSLDSVRVAIVVTGDYADLSSSCAAAIEAAGGEVQSVTRVSPSFRLRLATIGAGLVRELRQLRPSLPESPTPIASALAALLSRGGSADEVRALTDARLIEAQGDYRRASTAVVLVGGGRDEADRPWETLDTPLIAALADLNASVIGVEPSDAVQSYVPAYQARGISSADNVDTAVGRAAMVLLLAGERGSYGVKATARDGAVPAGVTEK